MQGIPLHRRRFHDEKSHCHIPRIVYFWAYAKRDIQWLKTSSINGAGAGTLGLLLSIAPM
jgi:hypothetical protein